MIVTLRREGTAPPQTLECVLSIVTSKDYTWSLAEGGVSRSLFLFPVYKCHFLFTVIIMCLCRTYVLWIGSPRKCRHSLWNFIKFVLFLSEAISISGLQAPFCFFPVIIIYLCRAYIL